MSPTDHNAVAADGRDASRRGQFLVMMTACGQSVAEAAEYLGVGQRTINRWRSGYHPVPEDVLEALGELKARIEAYATAWADGLNAGSQITPMMTVTRQTAPLAVPGFEPLPNAGAGLAAAARVWDKLPTGAIFVAVD